jgi:hypothetical protein
MQSNIAEHVISQRDTAGASSSRVGERQGWDSPGRLACGVERLQACCDHLQVWAHAQQI